MANDDDDDFDFDMDEEDNNGPTPPIFSFAERLPPARNIGTGIGFRKEPPSPCRRIAAREEDTPITKRYINLDWVFKIVNSKILERDVK